MSAAGSHLVAFAPSNVDIKLTALHGQLSKAAFNSRLQLLASCPPLQAQLRGSFTQLLLLGCQLLMQLFLLTCTHTQEKLSHGR